MDIEAHKLKVLRTAHYYSLGKISQDVRYLVVACHGYGQLAKHFIRKFDIIARPETLIIAPEGLSRFYWEGFSGEVVASWMTSADRLDEIKDYTDYLQRLCGQMRYQLPEDCKVILFGFSQGCATILRWIMRYFPEFDHLVLWAGKTPEDLDYRPHQSYFSEKRIDFFYGDDDYLITPEQMEWQKNFIDQQQLQVHIHQFNGKHTVDRTTLKHWFNEVIYNIE